MRRLFLFLLLSLAACGTPQERCISAATKDLRVLDGLIAATRGNLERGYAIETQEYLENERQVCGVTPDNKKIYCDVPVAHSRDVPVALDLNAEQAKLNSLLARRDRMARDAATAIQQCRTTYPEA